MNTKAQLNYKVGLLIVPEINLLNTASGLIKSGNLYWLGTPNSYRNDDGDQSALCYVVHNRDYSTLTSYYASYPYVGVRPVISIKPNTIYSSGDGSKENPYIIETN